MKLITSISGIRGIYGQTLTDSIASKNVNSFSDIKTNETILLAQDSSPHGKYLYEKYLLNMDELRIPADNFSIKVVSIYSEIFQNENLGCW